MTRQLLQIVVGLFLLWLMFVLFATSARGPGLCPDSMSYLAAAESIALGIGPEVPLAEWSQPESHTRLRHFPPLFPALIALAVRLGASAVQSARWVEALAAGMLAVLLACIAASCVRRTRAGTAALLTGTFVLLAPAISLSYLMVLSEPAFLMFWALALLLMVRAPQTRLTSLALGCTAACCALTRYAGVSVTAAVVAWVLMQRGSWWLRCSRAALAAAPTFAGLLLWRVWSGGEFRRYAWYLDGFEINAHEGWDTLRQSLVPIPETFMAPTWLVLGQALVSVGVVGLTSMLLVRAARRTQAGDAADVRFSALWRATSLLGASYLCVLLASRLRADPEIPFDWRILSPLILSWQLTLSVAIVRQWGDLRSRAWQLSAAVLTLSWLAAAGWNTAQDVLVMQREGALYDGAEWQDSEFARWLRSSGRQYALYSNNPAPLWLLDHRSSWLLPGPAIDDATRARFVARVRERPSALLGFRDPFTDTADPQALAAWLRLAAPWCFEQVCVWTAPGPATIETAAR